MKKVISLLLVVFICLFSIGCKEKEKPYVLTPEGIPLIAIGGILEEYDVTTTPGPQVLQSELIQDNYDYIIAPVTLGAQLSIKTVINYKIAALITFDNMYIISKTDKPLTSLNDLNGKKVAAYGQNQPSDIMFKYALGKFGVECEIEYAKDVASVVSGYFMPDNVDYALVAEPYLSKVKEKTDVNVLDLAKVLRELEEGSVDFIPQAAIYVYKDLSKSEVKKVLKKIEQNINSLNSDANAYAKKLLEMDESLYPLFKNLGEATLTSVCNNAGISFLKAYDNKAKLDAFFNIVNNANSEILGGKLPEDSFYFNY